MSAPEPAPNTAAVPVRIRDRFDPRPGLRRVRDSATAIAQIVAAATGAYAFAHFALQHTTPLLAATVTVSSLGLVRDARPRRVAETVLGMIVGIAVAEVLLLSVGTGPWQIATALAITIVVARFLSKQASFAIAAAIQSLIVMIVPAPDGGPFLRLLDGLVGGIAALIVTALIPRNTRRGVARDAAHVFDAINGTVETLAQALRRGSRMRAERGLDKARAVDPLVSAWREGLDSAAAISRISPWLMTRKAELVRQQEVVASIDLATRNLRVVARRAVYLCDDGEPRPVAAELLEGLGRGAALVGESVDDIAQQPVARAALTAIAEHLDPREVVPGGTLGDQNMIAALRPLAVDLLVAAGMPRAEARRTVPRI